MKGKTKRVSKIIQLTESLDSSTNSCVTDLLVLYYTMGKRSQIQCEMSLRIQLTMNLNLCLCLKGKKKVGALRMEGGRDCQGDPEGADEGDGAPEQAAGEPHRLPDPMHRVQQLVLHTKTQTPNQSEPHEVTRGHATGDGGGTHTLSRDASVSRYRMGFTLASMW